MEPEGLGFVEAVDNSVAECGDGDELPIFFGDDHSVDSHECIVVRKPRLEDALDPDSINKELVDEVDRKWLKRSEIHETLIAPPVDVLFEACSQVKCTE